MSFAKDISCDDSLDEGSNPFKTHLAQIEHIFSERAQSMQNLDVDKYVIKFLAAVKTAMTYETSIPNAYELYQRLSSQDLLSVVGTISFSSISQRLFWQMGEFKLTEEQTRGFQLVKENLESESNTNTLPESFWNNVIERSFKSAASNDTRRLISLDTVYRELIQEIANYSQSQLIERGTNYGAGFNTKRIAYIRKVVEEVLINVILPKMINEIKLIDLEFAKTNSNGYRNLIEAYKAAGFNLPKHQYADFLTKMSRIRTVPARSY